MQVTMVTASKFRRMAAARDNVLETVGALEHTLADLDVELTVVERERDAAQETSDNLRLDLQVQKETFDRELVAMKELNAALNDELIRLKKKAKGQE